MIFYMNNKKRIYTINNNNFIVENGTNGWYQLMSSVYDTFICGIFLVIFIYINTIIIYTYLQNIFILENLA